MLESKSQQWAMDYTGSHPQYEELPTLPSPLLRTPISLFYHLYSIYKHPWLPDNSMCPFSFTTLAVTLKGSAPTIPSVNSYPDSTPSFVAQWTVNYNNRAIEPNGGGERHLRLGKTTKTRARSPRATVCACKSSMRVLLADCPRVVRENCPAKIDLPKLTSQNWPAKIARENCPAKFCTGTAESKLGWKVNLDWDSS